MRRPKNAIAVAADADAAEAAAAASATASWLVSTNWPMICETTKVKTHGRAQVSTKSKTDNNKTHLQRHENTHRQTNTLLLLAARSSQLAARDQCSA